MQGVSGLGFYNSLKLSFFFISLPPRCHLSGHVVRQYIMWAQLKSRIIYIAHRVRFYLFFHPGLPAYNMVKFTIILYIHYVLNVCMCDMCCIFRILMSIKENKDINLKYFLSPLLHTIG